MLSSPKSTPTLFICFWSAVNVAMWRNSPFVIDHSRKWAYFWGWGYFRRLLISKKKTTACAALQKQKQKQKRWGWAYFRMWTKTNTCHFPYKVSHLPCSSTNLSKTDIRWQVEVFHCYSNYGLIYMIIQVIILPCDLVIVICKDSMQIPR